MSSKPFSRHNATNCCSVNGTPGGSGAICQCASRLYHFSSAAVRVEQSVSIENSQAGCPGCFLSISWNTKLLIAFTSVTYRLSLLEFVGRTRGVKVRFLRTSTQKNNPNSGLLGCWVFICLDFEIGGRFIICVKSIGVVNADEVSAVAACDSQG